MRLFCRLGPSFSYAVRISRYVINVHTYVDVFALLTLYSIGAHISAKNLINCRSDCVRI